MDEGLSNQPSFFKIFSMKQLKFKCIFLGSAFLKYMLLFQAHWRRGLILRQKKLFRESFSAFLEGYRKGDGTVSEKLNILVEAVASFSNITGFFLTVEDLKIE